MKGLTHNLPGISCYIRIGLYLLWNNRRHEDVGFSSAKVVVVGEADDEEEEVACSAGPLVEDAVSRMAPRQKNLRGVVGVESFSLGLLLHQDGYRCS